MFYIILQQETHRSAIKSTAPAPLESNLIVDTGSAVDVGARFRLFVPTATLDTFVNEDTFGIIVKTHAFDLTCVESFSGNSNSLRKLIIFLFRYR